jgi:putative redox protein
MSGQSGWPAATLDNIRVMMDKDFLLAHAGPPERWMEKSTCRTAEASGGLTCTAISRGHRFTIDEPLEFGGSDLAANPLEILLGALGASLQVTARLYATSWNLPVDRLWTSLSGTLDIRGFFDADPDVSAGFGVIDACLNMATSMSNEDFARLEARVRRCCPVLAMLGNGTLVELAIVREPAGHP